MSKETLLRLNKYANDVKLKLSDTNVPDKHKNRPVQYRQFLQREFSTVTAKIDALKMSVSVDLSKK